MATLDEHQPKPNTAYAEVVRTDADVSRQFRITGALPIGVAEEDLSAGDAIEINPETGKVRRCR